MNFGVTPTTEQDAFADFGDQFVPAPQQPSRAQVESLAGWVAMVEVVSRGTVAIVAANRTASAQPCHQQALAMAAGFPLVFPVFCPTHLGCPLLSLIGGQKLRQTPGVVCSEGRASQTVMAVLQIA
jgi:hypothetical protein